MYKSFKHLALNSAHRSGLLRGLHYFDSIPNSVYVLAYHRVDWESAQPRLDPKNLSATPDQFDRQMRLLASEYHPVTAAEVLSATQDGRKLPARAVLVTVDDGYRDFKEHIWRIASAYKVYPVLFVPTAYVGVGVFWWDKLYNALNRTALTMVETPAGFFSLRTSMERELAFSKLAQYMKRSPFDLAIQIMESLCQELVDEPLTEERVTMDWNELRELARAGVTIAPHTHTHPALGNISQMQARFEVAESRRIIMREIGDCGPLFAYSYGSPESIRDTGNTLQEQGYQLAFTMQPGRARLDDDDRMYLPRIEVNPQLTLAQFHARLTPVYDLTTRRKRANNGQ